MTGQIRFPRIAWCVVMVAALGTAQKVVAQMNDQQPFNGTLNTLFAVPAGSVPYWSVDGACSPALIFRDGVRGDNGTPCLQSLLPVGVGTRLVKDLNPGPGGSTFGESAITGLDVIWRLWISADDGSGGSGQELYRVLGPLYPVLTRELDINPGPPGSTPADMWQQNPGGAGNMYFSADDGTNGREPWLSSTSSGLSINNAMLGDINPAGSSNPTGFASVASVSTRYVVFAADDGTNGRELWATTGGGAPTLLKDINVSAAGASSDPQLFTTIEISGFAGTYDIRAMFAADDGANGRELWRTDGTLLGTAMCKDIRPGPTGSNPGNLTNASFLVAALSKPVLAFTADSDGSNGQELWTSRGALDGSDTVQVYDPGAAGSPANLTAVRGLNLLFFTLGNDLWRSDGTNGGTVLVKSFASPPTNLVSAGGAGAVLLYFVADDGTGSGAELWKSDGAATTQVLDIRPGPLSSSPQNLHAIGGTVYFSADDGTNGRELWRTDSSAGALMVMNINATGPGAGSDPGNFATLDGTLVFSADDGVHGRELWQSDGFAVPDHVGMSYKWDISSLIQSKGDPSKIAVVGADSNPFYTYWLHDFPAMGGAAGHISEAAHQVNVYVELTDGTDRVPLNVTQMDCGDGNVTRPTAALTDGNSHNAIAFGMVAVLDQNPCDTDVRGGGSPTVPYAHVPAVYDGQNWIPVTTANIPAGVPTAPPSGTVLGQTTTWAYMATGLPANLVAATEDPWSTKRFAWGRIDVWTDYITVCWGSKQLDTIWVATVPRQYKGAFKSLYFGNPPCLQPAYPFYLDTLFLNGGILVDQTAPFGGACCQAIGTCIDVASAAQCPGGTYTAWRHCGDPTLPQCCPTPWADTDGDGDVDQKDFGKFQLCFTGSTPGLDPGCECLDKVQDNLIDLNDFNEFENCWTGPEVPFGSLVLPNCDP